eukprot:Amastigsp_a1150_8.p1 type:complete len:189 gc:universal Amastigsp_a1150_8:678-112(-)
MAASGVALAVLLALVVPALAQFNITSPTVGVRTLAPENDLSCASPTRRKKKRPRKGKLRRALRRNFRTRRRTPRTCRSWQRRPRAQRARVRRSRNADASLRQAQAHTTARCAARSVARCAARLVSTITRTRMSSGLRSWRPMARCSQRSCMLRSRHRHGLTATARRRSETRPTATAALTTRTTTRTEL